MWQVVISRIGLPLINGTDNLIKSMVQPEHLNTGIRTNVREAV